jgi:ABC-type transport system involved in multi-copper enzyme maturation permease subunit
MSHLTALERRKTAEAERRLSLPMWTRTGPFYHWLIDFYFFVMVPLACVGACGPLIREELQADTLGFLLTRPVTRARLVLAKHLALTVWLQIVVLVEALLLFLSGALREVPSLLGLLPLFLVAQFLAVLAWSALGTLLGLISKKYMALALVYGLIVEMGIGRIPTNINTLSLMRHLKTLLAHNSALQSIYEWPASGVPLAIIALLFAPVLFLALSAVMFTLAEYHHNAEMQK